MIRWLLFTHWLCVLSKHAKHPKLLLISFDGFRHDYIEKYNLTVFKRFAQQGARAKRVRPCFATVTFPNHFSIVTGLYENLHGVVSNEMYDNATGKMFDMHTPEDECEWWSQNPIALPIWVHNQNAGGSSGTVCWVSSLCHFGYRPLDHHLACNATGTSNKSVETIFSWFADKNNPINFGALYFDEPDSTGHRHGPDSDPMKTALKNLEVTLEHIERKIEELNLTDSLNVMIVSDHGMTDVDSSKSILLDDYVNHTVCKSYGTTTVRNLFPTSDDVADAVFRNLSSAPHVQVFYSSQLTKLHYSKNSRIGQLVLIADPGYLIFKTNNSRNIFTHLGNHGYLNSFNDMFTIFLARGPSFGKNVSIDEMRIVDIFPLLVELLQLDRHLVDRVTRANGFFAGSLDSTIPLLSYIPKTSSLLMATISRVFGYVLLMMFIAVAVVTTGCIAFQAAKRSSAQPPQADDAAENVVEDLI